MAALYRITQSRTPDPDSVGTPGVARIDLWLNRLITLTATAGDAPYAWTLLDKPPGSAAVLSDDEGSSVTFTPDVRGTYRVRMRSGSGGAGNTIIRVMAVRFDNDGDLLGRGYRTPAFEETADEANYAGNARGYAKDFEAIVPDVETNAFFKDTSYSADVGNVLIWDGSTWVPGDAVGGNVLVFQPGGTAGGNVYDVWADLVADLADLKGTKFVFLDNSLGSVTLPSGTWALGDTTTFIGRPNDLAQTTVTLANGCVLQDLCAVTEGLKLFSVSASAALTYLVTPYLRLGRNCALQASGAGAMRQGPWTVEMAEGSSILAAGQRVWTMGAHTGLLKVNGPNCTVQNAIGDAGASSLTIEVVDLAATIATQSFFSGALTITRKGLMHWVDQVVTSINVAVSPYAMLTTTSVLSVDCSGGAVSVTLPPTSTAPRQIRIKDASGNSAANPITVNGEGMSQIDGQSTFVIQANFGSVTLVRSGSHWLVV